jgi:chromosome segregation ATPase
MHIHVHIHHHDHASQDVVVESLNDIKQKQKIIMGQLDDLKNESAALKEQVTALQASVDTEQAQIAALLATNAGVVNGLNAQIAALEAQLANSVDPTALQSVIDEMKATREGIAITKADIEGTVADTPGETATS